MRLHSFVLLCKSSSPSGVPIADVFRTNFCSLFNLETLDDVIRTTIDATDEQPSTSLTNFYRQSIDLIQHFALSQRLITDARSTHLASVFDRMRFVSVDRIQLSYTHGTDLVKPMPGDLGEDTFIDEPSAKFYILRKFESSESRYIDTMVEFITQDETMGAKLAQYIRSVLKAYQRDAEHGLERIRQAAKGQYEPKWTIPEDIIEETAVVVPAEVEEDTPIEKPVITAEEIAALVNEPSLRIIAKPKEESKEEEVLTSFPARQAPSDLKDNSARKPPSTEQPKPKIDNPIENKDTVPSTGHHPNSQGPRTDKHDENDQRVPNNHESHPHHGTICLLFSRLKHGLPFRSCECLT